MEERFWTLLEGTALSADLCDAPRVCRMTGCCVCAAVPGASSTSFHPGDGAGRAS